MVKMLKKNPTYFTFFKTSVFLFLCTNFHRSASVRGDEAAFSHQTSVKMLQLSGLNQWDAQQTHADNCVWARTKRIHTQTCRHTHTHTCCRQPGEMCVCSGSSSRSTFIRPTNTNTCCVMRRCRAQTQQPNNDTTRHAAAAAASGCSRHHWSSSSSAAAAASGGDQKTQAQTNQTRALHLVFHLTPWNPSSPSGQSAHSTVSITRLAFWPQCDVILVAGLISSLSHWANKPIKDGQLVKMAACTFKALKTQWLRNPKTLRLRDSETL